MKTIKRFVWLLVFVVTMTGGLLYVTKLNKNKNIKNNQSKTVLVSSDKNQITQNIKIDEEEIKKEKTYDIKTKNGTSKLQIQFTNGEEKTNLLSLNDQVLIDNYDKELEEVVPLTMKNIMVYNNFIVVYLQNETISTIDIFDIEGKHIKKITDFMVDEQYYSLSAPEDKEILDMDDESLTFIGTKAQIEANSYLIRPNEVVNLCEVDNNSSITDDSIVTAYFKIDYQKDQFNEIRFYKTIELVKSYKECE